MGGRGMVSNERVKSTCDDNANQLTLGVEGGGSKALQHYHRTKST